MYVKIVQQKIKLQLLEGTIQENCLRNHETLGLNLCLTVNTVQTFAKCLELILLTWQLLSFPYLLTHTVNSESN